MWLVGASQHLPCLPTPLASRGVTSYQNVRVRARYTQRKVQAAVSVEKQPDATRTVVRSHTTDVVVIGSGVGGLSCAGLLAKYGDKVTVCESHSIPGGAAHAWVRDGYHFESGPSLYSGMAATGKEANPLSHVLQAIGEPLELIQYSSWNVILPEGEFLTEVGARQFCDVLQKIRGPDAVNEWKQLQEYMRPYAAAATLLPPAAIRFDPGVAVTAFGRYLPSLIKDGGNAAKLTGSFGELIKDEVRDPFIRNWLDLLCFMLSGLPADGTIAAEVAFMFNEWYRPKSYLEFPKGGSQAMVDALVRGVTKHGGKVHLNSHVEEILIEGGRAAGVKLRNGSVIRARKAVVSNATLWDTARLLPRGVGGSFAQQSDELPACRSFMHLHLGFDAIGLEGLEMHHIVVNSWEGGVDAEQNVVLISIPSVMDPDLAPPGKHVLHAYYPATEPYDPWKGLDRKSEEYKKMKEERSVALWQAVERVIPDIRQRITLQMVGSPLTHQRFLRRHAGSYGPAVKAGTGVLPSPVTPVPSLLCCGDSVFPGIGLPAVAASGTVTAATLMPLWNHWKMMEEMGV